MNKIVEPGVCWENILGVKVFPGTGTEKPCCICHNITKYLILAWMKSQLSHLTNA